MTCYFKLASHDKFLVLSNPDAIAMLLADFAWYEIPAWDYERRNRQFAHKVFVTPAPVIHDEFSGMTYPRDLTSESQPEHASGPDLSDDDFRNEGTGLF